MTHKDDPLDEILDGFSLGTVMPDRNSALTFAQAKAEIHNLIKQSQLDLLNDLKTKKVKGANLVELKWIDEALLKIKEELK